MLGRNYSTRMAVNVKYSLFLAMGLCVFALSFTPKNDTEISPRELYAKYGIDTIIEEMTFGKYMEHRSTLVTELDKQGKKKKSTAYSRKDCIISEDIYDDLENIIKTSEYGCCPPCGPEQKICRQRILEYKDTKLIKSLSWTADLNDHKNLQECFEMTYDKEGRLIESSYFEHPGIDDEKELMYREVFSYEDNTRIKQKVGPDGQPVRRKEVCKFDLQGREAGVFYYSSYDTGVDELYMVVEIEYDQFGNEKRRTTYRFSPEKVMEEGTMNYYSSKYKLDSTKVVYKKVTSKSEPQKYGTYMSYYLYDNRGLLQKMYKINIQTKEIPIVKHYTYR